MSAKPQGGWTVLSCGSSYQAVLKSRNRSRFVLPHGFRLVASLGGNAFWGYAAESSKTVLIAFRGTESLLDVQTDLNCQLTPYPFVERAGYVHRGFCELYTSQLRTQLLEVLARLSPRKRLMLTGHSLGGALATVAGLDIAGNTRFRKPCVHTFGCPKVGDADFAAAFGRSIPVSVRVENVHDLVPAFPPSVGGELSYVHVNKALYIEFSRSHFLSNHQIAHYAEALAVWFPEAYLRWSKRSPGFLP